MPRWPPHPDVVRRMSVRAYTMEMSIVGDRDLLRGKAVTIFRGTLEVYASLSGVTSAWEARATFSALPDWPHGVPETRATVRPLVVG